VNNQIVLRLTALLAIIAAICIAVAVVAIRNLGRAVAASDWVNHTHAVILALGEMRAAFHASDAALWTLAVAASPENEAGCREALASLQEQLAVAKALTRREPAPAAQINRLEALADARAGLTRDVLAAHRAGNSDRVRSLLAAATATGLPGEVRRLTEKLKLEQMELLATRDSEAYLQAQTTRWTVWSGVVLNLVLLGLAAWLVRDDIAARRRAAAVLQEANEQLEAKVRERTAELTRGNAQLAAEILERKWGAQALEHQLRYNELIINSITDLVLVLTKALNISRINPAVAHLTGFDSARIVNRPLPEFVRITAVPRHLQSSADPLGQVLKEGRDLHDVAALLSDRQGREIPVRLTLFPLRDGNKVVGGVAILRTDSTAA
jgi:PAS domain S-box-containing protein